MIYELFYTIQGTYADGSPIIDIGDTWLEECASEMEAWNKAEIKGKAHRDLLESQGHIPVLAWGRRPYAIKES